MVLEAIFLRSNGGDSALGPAARPVEQTFFGDQPNLAPFGQVLFDLEPLTGRPLDAA